MLFIPIVALLWWWLVRFIVSLACLSYLRVDNYFLSFMINDKIVQGKNNGMKATFNSRNWTPSPWHAGRLVYHHTSSSGPSYSYCSLCCVCPILSTSHHPPPTLPTFNPSKVKEKPCPPQISFHAPCASISWEGAISPSSRAGLVGLTT